MASTSQLKKTTFGEYTIFSDIAIQGTVHKDVMSGPCVLHAVELDNRDATVDAAFLKLYDSLNPTVGTTVPEEIYEAESYAVQTGATADAHVAAKGRTAFMVNPPNGIPFETGLSFAAVTTGGTGGTTGVAECLGVSLLVKGA